MVATASPIPCTGATMSRSEGTSFNLVTDRNKNLKSELYHVFVIPFCSLGSLISLKCKDVFFFTLTNQRQNLKV